MKNVINQSRFFFYVLAVLLTFSACQKNGEIVEAPAESLEFEMQRTAEVAVDTEIPGVGYEKEVTADVKSHGINLDVTEKIDFVTPDGKSEAKLLVDNCIVMSEEELRELMTNPEKFNRQYSTNNLVSPQTINVVGWNSGAYALTTKMRTALSWAVNNYNALPLNLNFSLSYSTNSSAADIVVYRNPYNSGAGGVAGFPSGGQPYKWVQIYSGMDSYNTNVNEHVITHEIGHCLGLRHTDYFSRASCNQNSNEGSAGVGANHVPGTPTGIDWNSVMLACFNSGENGEFGYYDRVALQYLY